MTQELFEEVRKAETERSFFDRIKELLFCHFQGHYNRITSVWAGKYKSRYCQKCHKRIELW